MEFSKDLLINLKPEHDFFVGIDSDGCAFDSMELKHKECFIPVIIREWGLQAISKYVREAAEFVNLYSKWRGTNRFPALIKVFELLKERDEVIRRGIEIPDLEPLKKFVDSGLPLGDNSLEKMAEKRENEILKRTLKWSKEVNKAVRDIVKGVPPFPLVREVLQKLLGTADVIVVSATPGEALVREWEENKISQFVKLIAGQEMGSKKEHIELAAKGKYDTDHVLMIGDAPGDLKAAKANNALFYPVIPGNEEKSWQKLFNESIDVFLNEDYEGKYEEDLIKEFEKLLPDRPPWLMAG